MGARKNAKEAGLKTYSTGKPCKKGHISDRRTDSASCCECERLRKATPEYKEKFSVYLKEYQKEYYKDPKQIEKRKAYLKKYYQEHKATKV